MDFHSPSFWVGVAFVIFVAAVFKPIRNAMFGALDSRGDRIRDELEQARNLREEAQATLAHYQRKQQEMLEEAEDITVKAKEEAERIREAARANIKQAMDKRLEMAEKRIEQSEQAIIEDVRNRAVEVASQATEILVKESIPKAKASKLIDEAIGDIEKRLAA